MPSTLMPELTFETFSIGSHNRWAHASGVAVAESPGTAYNPLFIYGGPQPARTHLLHATGNYARELYPSLDIRYVRAVDFGSKFAMAVDAGLHDDFRSRFLDAGMLLVAEIQLLQDAEAIQAEFLHVFTTLHKADRQLVISSDRASAALASLSDSLRDRLGWGLAAEIRTSTNSTA